MSDDNKREVDGPAPETADAGQDDEALAKELDEAAESESTGSDSQEASINPTANVVDEPYSDEAEENDETALDADSVQDAVLAAAAVSAASSVDTDSGSQDTPKVPEASNTQGSAESSKPVSPAMAQVAPAPASPAFIPEQESRGKEGTNVAPIAWLALVLVLILAAGGFYLMMDMQRREGLLLQRVQGLEAVSGQDVTTFDQMRDNLQRAIDLELEGLQARQQRAEEDLQRSVAEQQRAIAGLESLAGESAEKTRRELTQELATVQRSLQDQQQSMREQQSRINDLSVDDRESWLLAEAQYLLRLANQRLIMTGDTASAEALLRSTDKILRELGDADLHGLRGAVAEDLAAVRAVPKLDTQGLYLRLDALIRQTDALVMFNLPERESETREIAAEDWKARLAQGYEIALEKLSEYIVVNRRDVPVEALMDPQYEGLVRQNMRMLLEQAQVAMLSGNERLFRQSLERAAGWVSQFFKSDEQAAVAMATELQSISEERVAVDLPDLNRSLASLEEVMQARLARNGG